MEIKVWLLENDVNKLTQNYHLLDSFQYMYSFNAARLSSLVNLVGDEADSK